LAPIDFVAFANTCGAQGFRRTQPGEVRFAIQAALRADGPALVETLVDANEKPSKPNALKV